MLLVSSQRFSMPIRGQLEKINKQTGRIGRISYPFRNNKTSYLYIFQDLKQFNIVIYVEIFYTL